MKNKKVKWYDEIIKHSKVELDEKGFFKLQIPEKYTKEMTIQDKKNVLSLVQTDLEKDFKKQRSDIHDIMSYSFQIHNVRKIK